MTMWAELLMQVALPLVSTAATVAAGVIASKLNTFLKLKNEKQLRDALHQAAENGLKFAMARGTMSGSVVGVATDYVKTMNPGTVKRTGVTDEALGKLIRTKAAGPDVSQPH